MHSPICPYCGCSLARLGIAREAAIAFTYQGEELLFCCRGCLDGFRTEPDRYLAEIRELIVCPSCLAEKPRELAVAIEHAGEPVYFCRCPHCVERFEADPEPLLARLAI
jgi:YHS domain-containing protein